MRLLNTKTLRVQEFFTNIPLYAILSHTWEDEEVTFQDIQKIATLGDNDWQVTFNDIRAHLPPAQLKKGYIKVVQACIRARNSAFDWIWIDSCCINKESSAELSEAINSMYQYYEDAVVCYVYLFDVSGALHPKNPKSDFKRSKWFERGWTLQELLAPQYISFFDKDWTKIGTRWSLRDVISVVTTIPVDVFEGHPIDEYSIAQRMSWAAYRQTTRPEDNAYCLMGIFGISMSPIYGEGGEKAFMRLQQEIIRISDDRSIFAWISKPKGVASLFAQPSDQEEERGLLARYPYEFRYSGRVQASRTGATIGNSTSSYSFNNNGLHIHLPLEPCDFDSDIFLASLHCQTNDGSDVSVYLRRTTGGYYVRQYPGDAVLRSAPPPLDDVQELTVREEAILRKSRTRICSAGKNIVSLLPSARHFVCSSPPRRVSISTQFSVDFETSAWEDTNLTYTYPSKSEFFTLDFTGNYYYSLRIGNKRIGSIADPHTDYMLGLLPNSCIVSACLEMRGDGKKGFEVDYLSPEDSRSEGIDTIVHHDLGFFVPPKFGSYELQRSEKFWTTWSWVTVPDSELFVLEYNSLKECSWDSDSDSRTERRNKRKRKGAKEWDISRGQGGPATFYVAGGYHQSVPWTHITSEGEGSDNVLADLQSRKADLYGQNSATATINHRKLRVWIGPATMLRPWFHQLHFEWVEDEPNAVGDKEMERRRKRMRIA